MAQELITGAVVRVKRKIKYTRPYLYPLQEHAIFYPWDCNGKLARFSLIEASTKAGKTVGCLAWIFEEALLNGGPGKNYWWIAPWNGTADIAFRRMKQSFPAACYEANESKHTITLLNGSVIWFKSAEKPDTLYGEDVYAAVVDEASRMREEAWHALYTTLTATRGSCRIIGNVKGRKNWFYQLARKAEKQEPDHAYFKIISADAVKAGVLDTDIVQAAERDLPANVFKELYLAEASDDSGNPFGGDAVIDRCLIDGLSDDEPLVWGWDLAKHVDWTVGTGLDRKGRVAKWLRFQKPWDETLKTIKEQTDGAPALVDSTGVGDPIVELLQRDLGSNFEGYNFTAPSKQKLMEGLAVSIQGRKVRYPPGVIPMELKIFEYEYTRTGVRYSAPEGCHDDAVCSLALANARLHANDDLREWEALA